MEAESLGFIETLWTDQNLEWVAVAAAVLYLLLVIRQNIWCWFFAFINTSIYIYLFHAVALYSESLLNVFYLVMAVYGWWRWRGGLTNDDHLPIVKWPWQKHAKLIVLTGLCVAALGYYMSTVGADYAYWDAFTTCFAVVTTFLVIWKVYENWYYWLVINSISMVLFWLKDLKETSALFALYLVLSVVGIYQWKQQHAKQSH